MFQLMLQSGRILVRIEDLERRIDDVIQETREDLRERSSGLHLRTLGTDFELEQLDGDPVVFSKLVQDGPVILVFFDPDSAPCLGLLPDLAHASRNRPEGAPRLFIVTHGSPDRNRRLFSPHQFEGGVLLQSSNELTSIYQVQEIPAAYLFDQEARLVTPLVTGADAVLALCEAASAMPDDNEIKRAVQASGIGDTTRMPPHHGPGRAPLRKGDLAPDFQAQTASGKPVNLSATVSRSTLLIFVDPLFPRFKELNNELSAMIDARDDLDCVVVSRRDPDLTLTDMSPGEPRTQILFQKEFQILDDFGPRMLPAGCLIDRDRHLLTDVQVGYTATVRLIVDIRDGHDLEHASVTASASRPD